MDIVLFQDGKILPKSWINLEATKAVKAKTETEA